MLGGPVYSKQICFVHQIQPPGFQPSVLTGCSKKHVLCSEQVEGCRGMDWHPVTRQKVGINKVSSFKVQAGLPRFTFPEVFSKITAVPACCKGLGSHCFWGWGKWEASFFMTLLCLLPGTKRLWSRTSHFKVCSKRHSVRSCVELLLYGRQGWSLTVLGSGTKGFLLVLACGCDACLLKRIWSVGSWLLLVTLPWSRPSFSVKLLLLLCSLLVS